MNDENKTTADLEQELENMTNTAKRALADLQNFKRQVEQERTQLMNTSKIVVLAEILPVLDNFERAMKQKPDSDWATGIENIYKQLQGIIDRAGLEEIEAMGKEVDPNLHEVVSQAPGEEEQVIEVIEKGYKMGTKVIRPAKVVVGNGK